MNVYESINDYFEDQLDESWKPEIKEDSDLLDKEYLVENLLWEMANVRGKLVKSEFQDLNFSFHFMKKDNNIKHAIRVKITWNPDHIEGSNWDGYIEAHGNYRYYQNPKSKAHPSKKDVDRARMFVRKNKVLFSAIWEGKLDENFVIDYFRGKSPLYEIVSQFELPSDIFNKLNYNFTDYNNLTELEKRVRELKAFNMND